MNRYNISEKNGIATLRGPVDEALISFEEKDNCDLLITYFNKNIAKSGLGIDCAKSFGEEFTITVSCKSKVDLQLCKSRYMELATNGFASELRNYIGMDWEDLEKVCFSKGTGKYIHKTVSAEEFDTAFKALIEDINMQYEKDFSAIVCVDGDISLVEFNKLVNLINTNKIVTQYLLNANARDVMMDIWVFLK